MYLIWRPKTSFHLVSWNKTKKYFILFVCFDISMRIWLGMGVLWGRSVLCPVLCLTLMSVLCFSCSPCSLVFSSSFLIFPSHLSACNHSVRVRRKIKAHIVSQYGSCCEGIWAFPISHLVIWRFKWS